MISSSKHFNALAPIMCFDEYKHALSLFPSGVCLLVTNSLDKKIGVTISSFSSVSLNPPIVQISLKNDSKFQRLLSGSSTFELYILSTTQSDHAIEYAKFPATEVPNDVLENSTALISCIIDDQLRKGDHTVVFGHVQTFSHSKKPSLIYYKSKFELLFIED